MCFGQKSKKKQKTNNHKNLCQSHESNPGPLAPKSNA